MAGKALKKSSLPGVSIRQLVEEIPEGCSTPDFVQKPVTLALQEGKNAIFRAVVCGDPKPEVHWQNAKGELHNSSKYQISSAPGSKEHVLQINKLTGEDSDLYRCTALNMYGEATCSVRLTVIEVGFRKNRKRQKEPQEDLRKELVDLRKMLKKRAPPPAPEKKMESDQVWQLLMTADRKDYEKICMKYGIVDFRGMLRKLQEMKKEQEDKMAQYVSAVSNLRHIRVTKEGVATFDLELDLKDLQSKIYLYKDGEMVPFGFDNQTKHCLRRLGKRYQFQIQDLRPEDAGLYQVMVEDVVVFSTELEARTIPPRVVVPLAEARCEEQGDAVFECTLSNPCPNATWRFQHRPLKPSDKYEVSVSPDGLTHRLVVRGACIPDKGLYSLDTGLYISSAWLVIEAGTDKDPQTTRADHRLQTQAVETSAEDSGDISGKGRKLREQGLTKEPFGGPGLASGLQLTVDPDRDGFGRHSDSLMGNGRGTDTAWGLGLERKGFLEAGDRGDNAPHGSPYRQGEGSESERELGFMERQLQGYGRDRDGDRSQGTTAGGWEAGSNHSQAGELGSSLEGKESRKGNGSHLGRHGQDQAGIRKRALRGSQADPEGSWLKREGKEMFQDSREDEMEGEDGLRTERGRGTAREGCASAVSLGEAGGSSSSELLGRRGSSNQAGMSPESCGSQGGREDGHGKARGYWELGECPGQTSGNRNLLGSRGLEVTGKGSLPGADQQGPGTVGGERSYTTGPGGPGDLKEWEGGLQGIQGKYGQDTGGALGRTGVGSPNLQSPQSWTAQQKGQGDPSRIESESTGPWDDSWSSLRGTGTHFGTRMRPPGGEESMDNAQVDAAMESGQGREARSYGLVRSSGLGTPRSDRTLGDREGIRDPGAVGSGLDFWNGTGSSRGEGFRGETSHQRGLGGPGGVASVYGDGKGCSRGTGPGNGAYYGDGSVLPEEAGSAHGVGGRVSSVGTGSEEGSAYRHGSGLLGEMWSRNKDHHSTVGRGSGIVAGVENGSGGPEGVPMEGARMWDASRGWGPAGPGRGPCPGDDVGSPGTVGSAGRDDLEAYGTAEMAGQGHVGTEPGASGRIKSWGQTRGDGDSRASGALGTSGKGGWEDGTGSPGAMDPGSLRVRGKETEGHGAWTSGAGTVYGDHSRPPAPYAGAGSESEWVHGSGEGVCYRDGSEVPVPQEPGGRRLYGGGPRSLGPGRTGPKGEGGISNGPEGLQGMGLAGEAAQGSGTGGSGTIPAGSEAGYRGGLEHSGGILSRNEVDVKGGTGIAGGRGSESEFGHKGGSGRSGGTEGGMHYGDGTGKIGGASSLARMKHEADPRNHKMVEPESGYWAASVGPTSSQGGPEKSRGMGFADGTGAGVGSGAAGMLGAADGAARGDSSVGPGWGTTSSHEGYGTSGIHEALGALSSRGPGIPGAPRDSGTARGEDGSAGQAGTLGSSRLLDGRGAAEGEAWAGITAPESEQKRNFKEAGSGPTRRSRVASQGGLAPQDAGDSLLGDRRMGAGSGSTPRAGQIVDSSSIPGGSSKSASGPDEVQGMSHAWAPGWEDQGFPGGSTGAVNQLSGSSSLQKNNASFRGTSKGPGGSGGGGDAGQEAAGGCQGPGPTEWADGVTLEPRGSGPQGAWNGLDRPFGRTGSGGRSGGIQGSHSHLSKGQEGEKPLREQGAWVDENGKGPWALKEYGGLATEESGRSGRRPGPYRNRWCQAQSRGESGAAETGSEDGGHLRETWSEDGSRGPHRHLDSRRGAKEDGHGVYGKGKDASQSPRSRYKTSPGSSSTQARGPMSHFSQGLADTEVQQGETATLSCTLARDLGPGTWLKDGVKLTAQDGIIFEQDGLVHRLLLAHVQGTQAGKYTFVAGDEQSEATLTVQDPPTIARDVTEKLREPLLVKAGKPVAVKIPFQSRLPVQAAWRKDGAEVVGMGRRGAQVALGDGFTRLCLPSAGRMDSGQYGVTLRSEGGSVQVEFILHVTDKPQPPQGPLEVQHDQGAGVRLSWRPPRDDGGCAVDRYVVERRQAGRSTWLAVAELPAHSTSFTDTCVEQGRKYAFRVRAVSSEGPGETLESEEVLVAPDAVPGPPSTPAILSASSQSITLTWIAPRGPGSAHILGYLVEKRKKGSGTWTAVNDQPMPERKCTVTDLRQGCQYEFRVTAVAPSGPGEPGPPSDAVFARDPMRPPGPVRDLQVIDTSNTSITLSWVGPDTTDGDRAQGYVVELCVSGSLQWSPCHTGTVPGPTFTAKGLRPQESYFVRVTSVNDGGCSQPTALDTLVHAMPVTVCPRFLLDASTKDSLTFKAGDTIRVPVSFEAVPMPEVSWLKDGLPLPKRSVTTSKDGLTQLLIPAASPSDSGRYTVVLRSLQGKEVVYSFFIRVAACPQAPGPIYLQENVPGTVTVQWEPSPDEARDTPLHYTVLVRSSTHSAWREVADRVHTNHFTLLGVLPGHEYHFRVIAKNDLGASLPSDTSQPWFLSRQRDKFTVKAPSYREPDLNQKPRFLVGLRPHLLPPGCECRMTCAVQGTPRPRVTWFKNGQSLDGSRALYSTDMLGVCSLIIPSVSPEDSGRYKAVAENPLGQAVSTATLIVTGSMYDGLADNYNNYGTTSRSSYYSKFQAGNGSWGYPIYNGTLKREPDNRRFSSYSQTENWSRQYPRGSCATTGAGSDICFMQKIKASRSEPDLYCDPRGTLRKGTLGSKGHKTTQNRYSFYSTCSGQKAVKKCPVRPPSCTSKQDPVYGPPISCNKDLSFGHSRASSKICSEDIECSGLTIPKAVQYLTSQDEKYQAIGAYYIQHTCFQDESAKQQVYQLGGICKLVDLLRSPNQNVQQAAAGALRNLVFRSTTNKLETRRQNGIREAVNLLRRTGSTEIQKQLTGLLWNLSSTDELKEELVSDALPVLTDRVIIPFSGWCDGNSNMSREMVDPEVFFNATGCLRNLSSADAGRQTMRNYSGLIDSLVAYVQNCVAASRCDDKSVENCMCILHNLSYRLDAEVPTRYRQLEYTARNAYTEKSSTGCFSNRGDKMMNNNYDCPLPEEETNPKGSSWLYHSDAIRTYLNLMGKSKKDATLEACAGALQNLTASKGLMSSGMSQLIGLKEKGLPQIARLLQSGNSDVVRSGASLLSNMSRHPVLHRAMGNQVFPEVTRLLTTHTGNTSNSEDILSSACYTVRNLMASQPQMAKQYFSSNMLNNVVNLCRSSASPKAAEAARLLLSDMWSSKELQGVLRQQGFDRNMLGSLAGANNFRNFTSRF